MFFSGGFLLHVFPIKSYHIFMHRRRFRLYPHALRAQAHPRLGITFPFDVAEWSIDGNMFSFHIIWKKVFLNLKYFNTVNQSQIHWNLIEAWRQEWIRWGRDICSILYQKPQNNLLTDTI